MPKLTKRTVEALAVETKDVVVWDDVLPSFGVRVKPSGTRSYILQYRNANGRSRRYTIGRHGVITADEARKEAKILIGEVQKGIDPAGDRKSSRQALTMTELLDRYIEDHLKVQNKPKTQKENERLINKRIRPALGHHTVQSLMRSDISKLHHSLRSTPTQANRVLAILSKLFNLAEIWGLREEGSNPCRLISKYTENRKERFLSEVELKRLGKVLAKVEAEQLENSSVINAIKLLAYSGCRLSEVIGLRWKDVDLIQGFLNLPDTKTGARIHVIGVSAISLLSQLPSKEESDWIFPRFRDPENHITDNYLEKSWRRIRKLANLEDVRLHDLRHTVGTYAGQAGANAFLVRDKLGHATTATTNRYVNRDYSPLRDLSDKVEDRISSALNGKE